MQVPAKIMPLNFCTECKNEGLVIYGEGVNKSSSSYFDSPIRHLCIKCKVCGKEYKLKITDNSISTMNNDDLDTFIHRYSNMRGIQNGRNN